MSYGGIFDWDKLNTQLAELQKFTLAPGFWEDNKRAQTIQKKISLIEHEMAMWQELEERSAEVELHFELIGEGEAPDPDIENALTGFVDYLNMVEIRKMLNGPDDHRGAILAIHPGAGGTESQDWANMLYRLYTRWCERQSFSTKILDFQPGD